MITHEIGWNMNMSYVIDFHLPCFLSIHFHVVFFSRCMHMRMGPNIHVEE